MEETLVEWILANQEHIPISGDLIKENAAKILDRLHPGHELFEFSNGWLETFKLRRGIKSFRRFGESGSVDMNAVNLASQEFASCWTSMRGMTSTIWMKLAFSSACRFGTSTV